MTTTRTDYEYHRAGNSRILHHQGLTRRGALQLVAYILTDNGLATKAEAQRFTATIKDDSPATYGPYTFTLHRASPVPGSRHP